MSKITLKEFDKSRTKRFGKNKRIKFDKVYSADKMTSSEVQEFVTAIEKFKKTPKNVAEFEKMIRFYMLGIPALGKARWDITKDKKDGVTAVLALPVEFADLDEIPPLNRFVALLNVKNSKRLGNQVQFEISYEIKNETDGWDIQFFNINVMMLDDEELTEFYSDLDRYFKKNDLMGEIQDIYILMEEEECKEEEEFIKGEENFDLGEDMEDLEEGKNRKGMRVKRKRKNRKDGYTEVVNVRYRGLFEDKLEIEEIKPFNLFD